MTLPPGHIPADELRRRLEEAEETLRAIREGEIDALVVRGHRQEEVFTLEGGVESYRAFMEAMDLGAAALDSDHRLLYANAALCALLDRRHDALFEAGLYAAFDVETADAVRGVVTGACGDGQQTVQIRIQRGDQDYHLLVTASPLQLGLTRGIAVTFTDLTERVRAQGAEERERQARAMLASANEAVVVCDREGVITHANAAVLAISAGNPVGRRFAEAIPLRFSGRNGQDFIARAIEGAAIQGREASAPEAPRVKDLLVSAAPLVVAGEEGRGAVVTLVDLTQRKAAERQQALLMRELDHRVKNTLALVIAICARTASNQDTIGGFQKAFTDRIHGLAATHTMLAEKSWSNLIIEDVLAAELKPFAGDGRVRTEGLGIEVAPRAAIALGLLFHELTTNAVKYGSLSVEGGHVTVRGEAIDGAGPFVLQWLESGGPEVAIPTHRGFGQTVIQRSLSYMPDGGTEIAFAPEGLRCTIRVPREDVTV